MLSEHLIYIYILPLTISAIFSLRAFRLNWPLPYRCFSVFLFVTLGVETFAILWKDFLYLAKTPYWSFSFQNVWLYNMYFIPQYLFYLLFFRAVISLEPVKKMLNVIIPAFGLFCLANITFFQGLYTPNNYTISAGCVLIILLVAAYFYQLLQQNKIINLAREPLVWISCGALLFHMGCLPFFIWFNALVASNMSKAFTFLSISVVLNSIMYSTYAIAFLWNKDFRE